MSKDDVVKGKIDCRSMREVGDNEAVGVAAMLVYEHQIRDSIPSTNIDDF